MIQIEQHCKNCRFFKKENGLRNLRSSIKRITLEFCYVFPEKVKRGESDPSCSLFEPGAGIKTISQKSESM